VLKEIRRVSGIDFEHVLAPRRAGDPAQLVADVSRAKQAMGFTARYSLSEIVETSWF
jgi:UDP-glucose 4-epimerase